MDIAESKRTIRTITLFFLAGLGSVGTLSVSPGGPFGRSSDFANEILACPSVHFAVFMTLAFLAARQRGLLLGWTDPPLKRLAVSSFGLALIWPMGIMVMLLTGFVFLTAMNFIGFTHSDSADLSPASFWQKRVDELPVLFALLTGAALTALVSASAVQYVIGRWPRGFLLGLVIIAIGVPVLTIVVGALLNTSTYLARLIAPVPTLDFPLLLFIGQPILGGVIGYWAHTAAQKRVVWS
jgi:hypothetical protein